MEWDGNGDAVSCFAKDVEVSQKFIFGQTEDHLR
jgi:hypothetical protein